MSSTSSITCERPTPETSQHSADLFFNTDEVLDTRLIGGLWTDEESSKFHELVIARDRYDKEHDITEPKKVFYEAIRAQMEAAGFDRSWAACARRGLTVLKDQALESESGQRTLLTQDLEGADADVEVVIRRREHNSTGSSSWTAQESDNLQQTVSKFRGPNCAYQTPWTLIADKHNMNGYQRSESAVRNKWIDMEHKSASQSTHESHISTGAVYNSRVLDPRAQGGLTPGIRFQTKLIIYRLLHLPPHKQSERSDLRVRSDNSFQR